MIYSAETIFWSQMLALPVERRFAPAPETLIDYVARFNQAKNISANPQGATVTPDFQVDLTQAIGDLPVSVKDRLEPVLLGIFFMSGLGSSAVTDVVARADGQLLGAFVAIDVELMADCRANAWASWKENTPFIADPRVSLQVRIADADKNDRQAALQYLLLHEFGHVLSLGENFLPDWWRDESYLRPEASTDFLQLTWHIDKNGQIEALTGEDFAWRASLAFYGLPQLPAGQMNDVYCDLATTGFPSLYALTCPHDDFAESFANYVHCVLLNKPYEILLNCRGEQRVFQSDFWSSQRAKGKVEFLQRFLQPRPARLSPLTFAQVFFSQINRDHEETPFLGLAPFLRLSISGGDLRDVAQGMLGKAQQALDNANLWMNLSTAFFSLQQRELGLVIQAQALQMSRLYVVSARQQPARFCLLMLMAEGDLAENTPLDCLLEDSGVDLLFYYASADEPLPINVPEHDALLVAISDTEANRSVLARLEAPLALWEKPVINAPQHIPNTERSRASDLLQEIPGLRMPPTRQISREQLQAMACGQLPVSDVFASCVFPIILRPVGSHAGRDLAKIDDVEDIFSYLAAVDAQAFFLSRFIDYRSKDGLFRKFRVALVNGQPFASHMAISSDWMIHYVNAGMYQDAAKRAEESAFMAGFAEFAARHREALSALHQRIGLDYVCIDCAETQAGELLIFEVDHAMVVHAMDPEALFPYKKEEMQKLQAAFEAFLFALPQV